MHQDNNKEKVPIQAVLLIRRPHKDFTCGEFYVAQRRREYDDEAKQESNDDAKSDPHTLKKDSHDKQPKIMIDRILVEWENAGELVLFMAGR